MKTALVTGANRGLGLAFVQTLLNNGYMVFAGTLRVTTELLQHKNLTWIELDVADDNSIEQASKIVLGSNSRIDIIINNAGVNKDTATGNQKELVCQLGKLNREFLLKMYSINALGSVMITKTFLPLLNRNAFIVNISSDRASFHDEFNNTSGNYGYRASKIALNMLTFCSTKDLPEGVRTFAVHPGDMKTDMNPDGKDDPKIQAIKILEITEKWNPEMNGRYLRYDGTFYPL